MKNITIYLFSLFIFANSSILFAFDGLNKFEKGMIKHEQMREKIETMRNWRIIEEFKLNEEQAKKVFSILKETDDERARLLKRRMELHQKLRELSSNENVTDGELNSYIQEFLSVNTDIAKIRQKEIQNLSTVFSPKELLQYMLMQERLMKEIGKMIKEKRMEDGEMKNIRKKE